MRRIANIACEDGLCPFYKKETLRLFCPMFTMDLLLPSLPLSAPNSSPYISPPWTYLLDNLPPPPNIRAPM